MANSATTLEVFKKFDEGLKSGTDSWQEVISNDVQFIGPAAQVKGKKDFIELNMSFAPMIKGSTLKEIVSNEDWVITQVEFNVSMPSGKVITLDMSEWYRIADGKIQSVKVFYDAEEFRKEMSANQ
ncbi:nuclear transport factor 2 family protein [Flagellimonas sp. S174]|uniref:nuclear transport factor 2 family protein n=1 Tax=Flagellimonas sp. S174 TaxID=3410790 RepID=UPI003BF50017